MAAIRSGVTPGCIARCFLRQSVKNNRGISPFTDITHTHLLQKSHLHTVLQCSGPLTKALLGGRRNQKFIWVSAVAVRNNSTQIPVGTAEPDSPPVIQTAPVTPPAEPLLSQPVIEQITPPHVDIPAPREVLTPPPEHVAVDPTPVLMQPVTDPVADAAPTALDVLQNVAAEPTLAELGLAAYTPVGLVQNLLESMHVNLGLPWWGAIVVGTVVARILVFPVIVKGQREAAKLNNVMPEMTMLSNTMDDAKNSGNKFAFAKAYSDFSLFQKKHDINPLRGFLIPLVQAPIFLSFFIALKNMAHHPVPSMQTGGMLWFPDLTLADPLYILPVVVTGTMYFILELGAESGIDNPNLKAMKTVFRIMPLVILPMTINFPTAVFIYWLTSNCFSLGQVALLNHSLIREKLRIPERIKHPPSVLPQNAGLFESIQKGWRNAQLAQQLQEREQRIKNHLDLAARGPLRQTFTHNPLQQRPPVSATSPKGKAASKTQPWKDTLG